jgi:hypothetical protein
MNKLIILRGEPQALQLWFVLKSNWKAMADAGKPLAVQITEHKAKRNSEQNRLYWSLLSEIAATAWVDGKQFSKEAWHGHFAGEFIGWEDTPGGHRIPISTTTLSVGEFADYISQVQLYAVAELGIELEVA